MGFVSECARLFFLFGLFLVNSFFQKHTEAVSERARVSSMAPRKRKAVKASAEDAGRKARQRIGGIPRDWDAKEVAEWVQEVSQAIGVEEEAASSLANRFMEEKWDGEALRDLDQPSLDSLGLRASGDRAKFMRAVRNLDDDGDAAAAEAPRSKLTGTSSEPAAGVTIADSNPEVCQSKRFNPWFALALLALLPCAGIFLMQGCNRVLSGPLNGSLNAVTDAKFMICLKAREWFLQATSCVFRPESILTPECYAFLWNLVL